jgi:transcription antitermination factor NusG
MAYWAALRCYAQHEVSIAGRLVREVAGAVIYLPRAKMRLERSLRHETRPIFPTYIFCDIDGGPPWQALAHHPGVIGAVLTGSTPSRCPTVEIAKLKAAEGPDGLVQLAGEKPPPDERQFRVGERVRIGEGAFAGKEGSFAGHMSKRREAIVVVALLGRAVTVRLPAAAIAALAVA